MWLAGILLLICHYQVASASKTIMTNKISMLSLGHKENTATFSRLEPQDIHPKQYRSARFERLRGAPENIKPIFVKPAVIETEEALPPSSPSAPIEVVPSSETVTEVPMEPFSPTLELPMETSPTFSEFSIDSSPFNDISTEPFITRTKATSTEVPTTVPASFKSFPIRVETSEEPAHIVREYAQEQVYPTAVSGKPEIEFVQVFPSEQIEVASTNGIEFEEVTSTTVKSPKRRRHKRKHRKHHKVRKVTETPTEQPTAPPTEFPIEVTTVTSLEPSTTPLTTAVSTTTTSASSTFKPAVQTFPASFPTVGTTGAKAGESYLGGWNEDEGVIVTTSGPSLGTALNQFSEVPVSIPLNDDKAIKEYYEKYYAEWYQKHNQATGTPGESSSLAPHQVKIELAKKSITSSPIGANSAGISSSTAKPTKEQLDKVCDYVAKISKSFGIKDLVGFAKNNCAFVKSFHPVASCEQIQHLMQYCVTGVLVTNQ